MKIFFSVGEPSGDLHGSNLIRQIQNRDSNVEFVGYGGPKMEAAGCRLHKDLTQLAVMWFGRVLLNIRIFWNLVKQADQYFEESRPDAVILIDYPGFNWWIARRAKARGIPVFYYGTPQIWAWAGWRVKKMRRFVDHVLCKLPFEEPWFRARGCNATYVGHPYFDQMREQKLDQDFITNYTDKSRPLTTILPGSRSQEVALNLPEFIKAAEKISEQNPNVRFAIAAYNAKIATLALEMLDKVNLQIDVQIDRTQELIHLSHCTMACSGSVSLELLYQTKPTVILYKISRPAIFVQRFFRKVKYITLVNLLAAENIYPEKKSLLISDIVETDEMLFPEYLTSEDKTGEIADHVTCWLTDSVVYEKCVEELTKLKAKVAHGGASKLAAKYILEHLDHRSDIIPKPHFQSQPSTSRRNSESLRNISQHGNTK